MACCMRLTQAPANSLSFPLPPAMLLPITELQRRAEACEYSELLDQVIHLSIPEIACQYKAFPCNATRCFKMCSPEVWAILIALPSLMAAAGCQGRCL